jgi:ATP-dependent RNA helicase DOB1
MADAFGDELFSVFEEDSTTAAGPKKDKEKEKGKWKGLPGSADKDG